MGMLHEVPGMKDVLDIFDWARKNTGMNLHEVICATVRIWLFIICHSRTYLVTSSPVQIDDSTPPERLPCSVHTFVQPLNRFPPNFKACAKQNGKGIISLMTNKCLLLNSLLSMYLFDHISFNYVATFWRTTHPIPSHNSQSWPRCHHWT